MNFSPDNRTTLETLLAGLQSGVSGSQVAPILNATLAAQAAQQEARTQKYQDMASAVTSLASQGMPYGATSSYVDAMTPQSGIPGRFQGLIDTAFADAEVPAQLQSDLPSFDVAGGVQEPTITPEVQSQLQSPLYTQNPMTQGIRNLNPGPNYGNLMTATGQQNYAANQAAFANASAPSDADLMGQVNAQINNLKANGNTPEQIAALINSDAQVQGVIMDNMSVFMQTQPEVLAVLAPSV